MKVFTQAVAGIKRISQGVSGYFEFAEKARDFLNKDIDLFDKSSGNYLFADDRLNNIISRILSAEPESNHSSMLITRIIEAIKYKVDIVPEIFEETCLKFTEDFYLQFIDLCEKTFASFLGFLSAEFEISNPKEYKKFEFLKGEKV